MKKEKLTHWLLERKTPLFMIFATLGGLLLMIPTARGTTGTLSISSSTVLTEDHFGNIVIDAD